MRRNINTKLKNKKDKVKKHFPSTTWLKSYSTYLVLFMIAGMVGVYILNSNYQQNIYGQAIEGLDGIKINLGEDFQLKLRDGDIELQFIRVVDLNADRVAGSPDMLLVHHKTDDYFFWLPIHPNLNAPIVDSGYNINSDFGKETFIIVARDPDSDKLQIKLSDLGHNRFNDLSIKQVLKQINLNPDNNLVSMSSRVGIFRPAFNPLPKHGFNYIPKPNTIATVHVDTFWFDITKKDKIILTASSEEIRKNVEQLLDSHKSKFIGRAYEINDHPDKFEIVHLETLESFTIPKNAVKEEVITADLTGDGHVNGDDLLELARHFGR